MRESIRQILTRFSWVDTPPRLAVRLPGKSLAGQLRRLGRLDEEEQAATQDGDTLLFDGDRFRPGSLVGGSWSGVEIDEDFCGGTTSGHAWTWGSAGFGAGASDALAATTDPAQIGVLQSTTNVASGSGRVWTLGSTSNRLFYGTPRSGSGAWLCVKIRVGSTNNTNGTWWAGLGLGAVPSGAVNTQFFGFRAYNTGSAVNWKLIGRVGTTDSELDLGVAADNSWAILAARRSATGWEAWASASGTRPAKVGTLPSGWPADTQALSPVFGVYNSASLNKVIDIDFWRLRARFLR